MHQDVKHRVNGIEVATWKMLEHKDYTARIPFSLVHSGEIFLEFEIGNPLAPCDSTNGIRDCRKIRRRLIGS